MRTRHTLYQIYHILVKACLGTMVLMILLWGLLTVGAVRCADMVMISCQGKTVSFFMSVGL